MLRSLWILLVLCTFLSCARAHCNECELDREREEDWKTHGCRSCKSMPVEFQGNCPKTGYDCDEGLKMRTNVLGSDSCECSQLRCKDGNASLAIRGELFTRVTCVDQKWSTLTKEVAESGICARKCGKGICRTHPDEYFNNNPKYLPFVVNHPDSEHSCAWGKCSFGAIASDSSGDHSYKSAVEFSSAGDRRWQDPNGVRHDRIACMQKECEPMGTDAPAIFCESSMPTRLPSKYECYAPQLVDDNSEKTMKCNVPKALRDSIRDTVLTPICSNGKWKSGVQEIAENTKVMCVTCPKLPSHSGMAEPTYEDTQVTCPTTKVLTIRIVDTLFEIPPVDVPVETMRCSDDIIWVTSGGEFGDHGSLADLIEDIKIHDYEAKFRVYANCI